MSREVSLELASHLFVLVPHSVYNRDDPARFVKKLFLLHIGRMAELTGT